MDLDRRDWMLCVISGYTDIDKKKLDKRYNDDELNTLYRHYIEIFKEEFNLLYNMMLSERYKFSSLNKDSLTVSYANKLYMELYKDFIIKRIGKYGYTVDKDNYDVLMSAMVDFNVGKFLMDKDEDGLRKYLAIKKTMIEDKYIKINPNLNETIKSDVPLFFYGLISALVNDGVLVRVLYQRLTDLINSNSLLTMNKLKDMLENPDEDEYDKEFEKLMNSKYAYILELLNELVRECFIDKYVTEDTNINDILLNNILIISFFNLCTKIQYLIPISVDLVSVNNDLEKANVMYFMLNMENIINNEHITYNPEYKKITLRDLNKILKESDE